MGRKMLHFFQGLEATGRKQMFFPLIVKGGGKRERERGELSGYSSKREPRWWSA